MSVEIPITAIAILVLIHIIFAVFALFYSGILFVSNYFSDFTPLFCQNLPSVEEANKIIEQNKGAFDKVQELSRGFVNVDAETCTGKAYILIQYETRQDKKNIKGFIGARFFGVPYRMQLI